MNQNNSQPDPKSDQRRYELNQSAVNSWGTAIVLDERVSSYSKYIRISGYFGFIIPVIVGAFALALGDKAEILPDLIKISAIILAFQAITAGTIVFFGLETKLRLAQESSSINKIFATEARDLAINVSIPENIYSTLYSELKGKIKSQENNDEKLGFSDKDKRKGARAGMKRFEQSCKKFSKIPESNSAKEDKSNCNNCGKF